MAGVRLGRLLYVSPQAYDLLGRLLYLPSRLLRRIVFLDGCYQLLLVGDTAFFFFPPFLKACATVVQQCLTSALPATYLLLPAKCLQDHSTCT